MHLRGTKVEALVALPTGPRHATLSEAQHDQPMEVMLRQGSGRYIPVQGEVPISDPSHELGHEKPLRPTGDFTIHQKVSVRRGRGRSLMPHPVRRRRQRLNLRTKNRRTGVGGIQDHVNNLVGSRRRSGRASQLSFPHHLTFRSRHLWHGMSCIHLIQVDLQGSWRIVVPHEIRRRDQEGRRRGAGDNVVVIHPQEKRLQW